MVDKGIPNISFPSDVFLSKILKNFWNIENPLKNLREIIMSYMENQRFQNYFPEDQKALFVMDVFRDSCAYQKVRNVSFS